MAPPPPRHISFTLHALLRLRDWNIYIVMSWIFSLRAKTRACKSYRFELANCGLEKVLMFRVVFNRFISDCIK
jgi:hypothetical protein